MKPSKVIVSFVRRHVAGLCVCMSLTHFNIKVHFCKLKGATMDIELDHRYLDAVINIDTKSVVKMWKDDRDEILACLAHELSHCVTSEMSDPFMWKGNSRRLTEQQVHFEERVTETVSRLALRLYKLENGL